MIENLLLVYVVSAVLYFCWNVWRAHVGDMNTIDILSNRTKGYEKQLIDYANAISKNNASHAESLEIKNRQIRELFEKINDAKNENSKVHLELEQKKNFINDLLCEIDALKSLNQKRKVTK